MKRPILATLTCVTALLLHGQANNYPNGSTVADFTVTDTQGNTHNLYTYTSQGKYVMLDFFFDTCPPCQATSQYFSQLYETYGCNAGDLVCLAINNGTDTNAEVDAYKAAFGGPFAHPPGVGIEGGCTPVDAAFGINAYPTYCLIGPTNVMINNDIWPVSSMTQFVAAFPAGSNITQQACLTSIQESASPTLGLAPTITTGSVEVTMDRITGRMLVMDLLGATILSIDVNGSDRMTLDLSAFADGHYLVRFDSDGSSSVPQRVVLAR